MRDAYVCMEFDEVEAGFEALLCKTNEVYRIENYMEEQRELESFRAHRKEGSAIAVLKTMWVEEDARGQGTGSQLMEEFLELVRDQDIQHIYLVADTYEDNAFDLVSWYESYGFRKVTSKEHCPLMYMEVQ